MYNFVPMSFTKINTKAFMAKFYIIKYCPAQLKKIPA